MRSNPRFPYSNTQQVLPRFAQRYYLYLVACSWLETVRGRYWVLGYKAFFNVIALSMSLQQLINFLASACVLAMISLLRDKKLAFSSVKST